MYRLLVYGLAGIGVLAIGMAWFGIIHMDPVRMGETLVSLLLGAFLTEFVLAKAWRRPMNNESWIIMSLIIFFIVPHATNGVSLIVLFCIGAIGSASKFLIAYKGKHLFNPAAFAASLVAIIGIWPASWWVGSSNLWWIVLLFGLTVALKTRHTRFVMTFIVVAVGIGIIELMSSGQLNGKTLQAMIIASPLIFLSTIMLTEPATMPSRSIHTYIFAAGAGVLYAANISIGGFIIYPEVALLIVNLYAFIVSPKFSTPMTLIGTRATPSGNVISYRFQPDIPFAYRPGQYMEWTLPHVAIDNRGNRRMFTIASSPTEQDILLGARFYNPSSTYKTSLASLTTGSLIFASQLSGSFTLPRNTDKKLLFIAGGIGVTPFRSMIKYVIDMKEKRDIVLLYASSSTDDFAYTDIFKEASVHGITVHYISQRQTSDIGSTVHIGRIDQNMLHELVPDLLKRHTYISGPVDMIDTIKEHLHVSGVKRSMIKTDYFSGY